MSVQAMAWVIKHSPHKGSDLLCLIMIANHAGSDGANAYPSIKTLARECRMSERQVTRIVQRLETSGALSVVRSNGRVAHSYTVNMSGLECDNPDNLSGLNHDNLSGFVAPTLTNRDANPDILSVNPDIAMSAQPLTEENLKTKIALAPQPRERDLLFEGVAECWMGVPYAEVRLNDVQRGNLNAAVKQLRKIGATPEQVSGAWERLRGMFDNPTPAALAKHWGTHGTGPKTERARPKTRAEREREEHMRRTHEADRERARNHP